jgi:hypothetical protein
MFSQTKAPEEGLSNKGHQNEWQKTPDLLVD